jgi:6,7-dimethyl-8-ribityllumazine synthase
MAFNHFIPTVWSDTLLDEFTATAVFANLVNREYEGVAAKGNKVRIAGSVIPVVKDYKAAGRKTTADDITDTSQDLLIDQEKSVDFLVDDIDRVQVAGSVETYTRGAAQALALDADSYIAAAAVAAGVSVSGAVPSTGNAAFDLINEAHKVLTKNNVPIVGRCVVVNAEFAALLRRADSKLTAADVSGDTAGLRAGTIGTLLGARIVESNNTPDDSAPQFIAFHESAIAYVSQVDTVEALRADDSFADRVRMLHVYGAKVVRPSAVAVFNKNGS